MTDLMLDQEIENLSPESGNAWLGAYDLILENQMLRRMIWEHLMAFDNEKEIIRLELSDRTIETARNLRKLFRERKL